MGLPVSRVAVKFQRHVVLPYTRGAERALQGDDAQRWRDIEQRSGGTLEPLFDLPGGALDRLLEQGKKSKGIQPPHLKGWFTCGCPEGEAAEMAAALRKWPAVETAYVMPDEPPFLTVAFSDDPVEGIQRFHRDAPEGLDIRYAWRYAGGNGDGINVMVVDRTFDLSHADLVHPIDFPMGPGGAKLVSGESEPGTTQPQHGAAALAVIMARDNSIGGVGMVPMARAECHSAFDSTRTPKHSTARAVAAAASVNPNFDLGRDVIVIELGLTASLDDQNPDFVDLANNIDRRPMLPPEADPATFDAIQAAVAAGIVVVEGSGNSDVNLDLFRREGKFLMDRTSPDFRDSGAIMVGAAWSSGSRPRSRWMLDGFIPGTNRRIAVATGNRIDCFGWADGVQTGLNGGAETIGLTSAATPMVGGAAASLQSIVRTATGERLPPLRVREVLSDPRFNTPSHNPPEDRIGVMPDLRRVIRGALGIKPQVGLVVRDFFGDYGLPSTDVQLGKSPDIIVSATERADAQADFGSVSQPGLPLSLSDPSFVYVRVRNAGRADATNVSGDVFWAALDDVVDPSRWHLIGHAGFPVVPPAATALTVSHPVRWDLTQSGSPGVQGTYMLIALITNDPDDPMPSVSGPFASARDFRAFVARHTVLATRKHTIYAFEDRWWSRGLMKVVNWLLRLAGPLTARLRPPWK